MDPGTDSDRSDVELVKPKVAPLEESVSVIKPVRSAFTKVVDYRTYRLLLRSSLYDGRVARHMVKCENALEVAMKSRCFNSSDPSPSFGYCKRSRGDAT